MNSNRPKRSTFITAIVGAFLIGLLLGHWGGGVGIGIILTAFVATALLWRSRLQLVGLMLLALVLGVARAHGSNLAYRPLQQQFGHKVTLLGQVSDDPATTDKGYTKFAISHLTQNGRQLAGALDITTTNSHVQRGYSVQITGKLGPTIGSRQASMFAATTVVSDHQSWLEHLRQRFVAGLRTALPAPLSDLALGLLLGARSFLAKSLQDQLALVGLSHLVAVSGYNLTIIVNAAYRPLRKVSNFMATAAAGWLILGFLIVSGFTASVVRAAVVSSLDLIARYYGRKPQPMTLIAVAAGLTAAYRPEYLWSDLGWQLSFLAFFGIMVLAPALRERLPKGQSAIVGLATESLAAQIMTFPLIAVTFGQLSVVAPLANLLILPTIPLAMLVSLVAGLGGVLIPALAGWLSWPAMIILSLILQLVNWLAHLPRASLNLTMAPVTLAAIYFLVTLTLIVLCLRRRQPLADIIEAT